MPDERKLRPRASTLIHLQLHAFKFGIGVRIASSKNQRCFMPRAGNYGSISGLINRPIIAKMGFGIEFLVRIIVV